MKISREEVLRVAELAHLELASEEISAYQGQLDDILTYVEKLNEIDVANVEPMTQVLFNPAGRRRCRMRILNCAKTFWCPAMPRERFFRRRRMRKSPSSAYQR